MTIEQIKRKARHRFRDNGGNSFSLTIFVASILFFVFAFFLSIKIIFDQVGWGKYFTMKELRSDYDVMLFWAVMLLILLPLLTAEWWTVSRLYIDIAKGSDFVETKKYLNAHAWSYSKKAVQVSLAVGIRKIIMLLPAVGGGFGVYYIINKGGEQLSSPKLLLLMLCLGFTGVWTGLFIRYIISLSMMPFIMCLNPRAKISKAIELSKRLMDGNHMRYLMFVLSFAKFVPLFILIQPIFIVYPYYKVCLVTFAEDILGDYWQDKMSASIRRWRRFSL
ncbi:MAG: hypothetical protein IJ571_09810 [Ruminococcus sp.]|nr:hypothetical protein [Ruminococcus sp.]